MHRVELVSYCMGFIASSRGFAETNPLVRLS